MEVAGLPKDVRIDLAWSCFDASNCDARVTLGLQAITVLYRCGTYSYCSVFTALSIYETDKDDTRIGVYRGVAFSFSFIN